MGDWLHVGCLCAIADRYSNAGARGRQKHFSLTTHMQKHSPHHLLTLQSSATRLKQFSLTVSLNGIQNSPQTAPA